MGNIHDWPRLLKRMIVVNRRLWIYGTLLVMTLLVVNAGAPTPNPGVWKGVDISFSVAEDGSKITKQGSKLVQGSSLIISFAKGNTKVTYYLTSEIPIENGKIRLDIDYLDLEGEFVSGTEAKGKATFRKEGLSTMRLTWRASWQADARDESTVRIGDVTSGNKPQTPTLQATRTWSGHEGDIWALAYTSDFQRLATGSADRSVKIWDLNSGTVLHTLLGHTKSVCAVAVSPDGKKVYSASEDMTVKVWDIGTGVLLQTFDEHDKEIRAIAVTPDGRQLISGLADGQVKIWDLAEGKVIKTLSTGILQIRSIHFLSDCKRFVVGGDNGFKLWSTEQETPLMVPGISSTEAFRTILTPDEKNIITCSGKVSSVWDLQTGHMLKLLRGGHTEDIISLGVSPDGRWLVSGARDGTLCVWNLEKGTLVRTFICGVGMACDLRFTPDGAQVIGGMSDGTLRFWPWASMQ